MKCSLHSILPHCLKFPKYEKNPGPVSEIMWTLDSCQKLVQVSFSYQNCPIKNMKCNHFGLCHHVFVQSYHKNAISRKNDVESEMNATEADKDDPKSVRMPTAFPRIHGLTTIGCTVHCSPCSNGFHCSDIVCVHNRLISCFSIQKKKVNVSIINDMNAKQAATC